METVEFYDEFSNTTLRVNGLEIKMLNNTNEMSVGLTDKVIDGLMSALGDERMRRICENYLTKVHRKANQLINK